MCELAVAAGLQQDALMQLDWPPRLTSFLFPLAQPAESKQKMRILLGIRRVSEGKQNILMHTLFYYAPRWGQINGLVLPRTPDNREQKVRGLRHQIEIVGMATRGAGKLPREKQEI